MSNDVHVHPTLLKVLVLHTNRSVSLTFLPSAQNYNPKEIEYRFTRLTGLKGDNGEKKNWQDRISFVRAREKKENSECFFHSQNWSQENIYLYCMQEYSI